MLNSNNYLELLLNEYESKELTKEDLKSTIKHYGDLRVNESKKSKS